MMQQSTVQPVIIILQIFMQQGALVFVAGILIDCLAVLNGCLLQFNSRILLLFLFRLLRGTAAQQDKGSQQDYAIAFHIILPFPSILS